MKKSLVIFAAVLVLFLMSSVTCMATELGGGISGGNNQIGTEVSGFAYMTGDSVLILYYNDNPCVLYQNQSNRVGIPTETVEAGYSLEGISFVGADEAEGELRRNRLTVEYRADGSDWQFLNNDTGLMAECGVNYEFLVREGIAIGNASLTNEIMFHCIFELESTGGSDSDEDGSRDPDRDQEIVTVSPCIHAWSWKTVLPVTSDADGMECLQCEICGACSETRSVSAFGSFLEKNRNAILAAAPGAVLSVDTDLWVSFDRKTMEALDLRPDVSLNISFRYKGEDYLLEIPRRTGDTRLTRQDTDWYGYLFLGVTYPVKKADITARHF